MPPLLRSLRERIRATKVQRVENIVDEESELGTEGSGSDESEGMLEETATVMFAEMTPHFVKKVCRRKGHHRQVSIGARALADIMETAETYLGIKSGSNLERILFSREAVRRIRSIKFSRRIKGMARDATRAQNDILPRVLVSSVWVCCESASHKKGNKNFNFEF